MDTYKKGVFPLKNALILSAHTKFSHIVIKDYMGKNQPHITSAPLNSTTEVTLLTNIRTVVEFQRW